MNLSCFEFSEASFSVGHFDPDRLLTIRQTHGATGAIVDSRMLPDSEEGDWLATYDADVAIAIKVADCTAILMEGESSQGPFVAGIHAGWRGTASGVIEACLKRLFPEGPIRAWMSPSICANHFEVGEDVLQALGSESEAFAIRTKNPGKYLLDLKKFQSQKLHALLPKDSKVFESSLCTACQSEFFSYRRAKGNLKKNERHYASIRLIR